MFNDIFPMMASHQIELDEFADQIIRRIRIYGTENQTFSITPPFSLSPEDLEYIEERVNAIL